MRMQVILFTRPGSAPIAGGKKGEFRDWTRILSDACGRANSILIRYVGRVNF